MSVPKNKRKECKEQRTNMDTFENKRGYANDLLDIIECKLRNA